MRETKAGITPISVIFSAMDGHGYREPIKSSLVRFCHDSYGGFWSLICNGSYHFFARRDLGSNTLIE
jgi:hypothetical protein